MTMTPAQEAKQYAADNGFVIEPDGRRYKVTHTATGHTFERGGYQAVLNEMQALFKSHLIATREVANIAALLGIPSDVAAAMFDTHVRKIHKYAHRAVDTAKWPWHVRVCGIHIGSFGTYSQAVKRVRQNYNAGVQDRAMWGILRKSCPWSATITYVGA